MSSTVQLMHENLRFVHLRRMKCASTNPVQVKHIFFLHSLHVIVIDGVISLSQISHRSVWYLRCVTVTSGCGPDSAVSRPGSASRVLLSAADRSFSDSAESAAVDSLVLLSRVSAARSVSGSVAVSVVASLLDAI